MSDFCKEIFKFTNWTINTIQSGKEAEWVDAHETL